MIIGSIDIVQGNAVQLIGGRKQALDAGDPLPIADRFGLLGEIAVVDLDAALGRGDNRAVIEALCRRARCRVGGGIRSLAVARRWLDAGAERIVMGTAAEPALLSQLPRERLVVALDAIDGEVVVDGWRSKTGKSIVEQMRRLRDYTSGFLVTFVEREGRMGGTRLERVEALVEAAGPAKLTIAGGVTTAAEVAQLDAMGADAQVGMALYTGKLDLAEAYAAPLRSDRPDGLWATVVVDSSGRALGLCWSNQQSLRAAIESKSGVYWSRRRGLWRKGESSGATQRLLRIDVDCDRDALRFVVEQRAPGFCHRATSSCWGELGGLAGLARTIEARAAAAPSGSYTRRLLKEEGLLDSKLIEEAFELAQARTGAEVTHETADLLYFAMVAMQRAGVSLADVERELDRRALRVRRRKGDAKPRAVSSAKKVLDGDAAPSAGLDSERPDRVPMPDRAIAIDNHERTTLSNKQGRAL